MNWLMDAHLLDRHDECGFPRMDEAARLAGHRVEVVDSLPASLTRDADAAMPDLDRPTVVYGSHQFVGRVRRSGRQYRPGAYCNEDELRFSHCAAQFGGMMLSDDFHVLPYAEVMRRHASAGYYRDCLTVPFFMRPDEVTKAFAGRVFDLSAPEDAPRALRSYMHVPPETLVVLAPVRNIVGEYRHVVVDEAVVASSQYWRGGCVDVRIDVEPECLRLAERVAKSVWQPDTAYVVDTCLEASGRVSIVEFNALSCSGMYACNTRA